MSCLTVGAAQTLAGLSSACVTVLREDTADGRGSVPPDRAAASHGDITQQRSTPSEPLTTSPGTAYNVFFQSITF
jgi:hypothetical protein